MKTVIKLTENHIKQLVNEVFNKLAVENIIMDELYNNPDVDEDTILQNVIQKVGSSYVDFEDIRDMIYELQGEYIDNMRYNNEHMISEDMTRSQVDSALEDLMKSREFEKRVNNIVVDTVGDFLESMWTKKSFWKTMLKKK